MRSVPEIRLRRLNDVPVKGDGRYVLYWMTAARRLSWNYALDRAVERAEELGKPLLVLEALDVDYRWASERHHAMIVEGMVEHARALARLPIGYHAYVEPRPGAGRGLLSALAEDACVVVTDDSPVFFTPTLLEAASRLRSCAVEAVDGCGLLPLRATEKSYGAAYHFRRFLQRELSEHLLRMPRTHGLSSAEIPGFPGLPEGLSARWPGATVEALSDPGLLHGLPIDHSVGRTHHEGGTGPARRRLRRFLLDRLPRYAEERNDPDADVSSGLSPWLHYGHLSSHEVFHELAKAEAWSPARLSDQADGSRNGWWGMSEPAEAFLDQLVTWRELGFTYLTHESDFGRYEALPEWARETLEAHVSDEREHVYDLDGFDSAETHDELWNAAQRQLREEGVIQNYLRMLWGKKILEWTEHPRRALEIMIELNNRYAVDGRDPNSYAGIEWVLGRFDRGWPERPVYGKVRSMTSASARRKLDLDAYLARWGREALVGAGA